jgi:Lrp/AsnC family transcriptional regulator
MKILAVLQEDGALSAAEVAEAVGLSQSPCWRRIQRLKAEGYISKIVAVLNRQKLELRAHLFVHVKVVNNDKHNLQEFSSRMDRPADESCSNLASRPASSADFCNNSCISS